MLYLTKDSSVAQDFKLRDMFSKFYGDLCQKNKLPDTGKLSYENVVWDKKYIIVLMKRVNPNKGNK